MSQPITTCPHCGAPLRRFTLPDNTGWHEGEQLACFNDSCPYFRRGWTWMFDHYGVKSSYRFRIDATGHASALAVWSKTALKDRIVEDDAIEESIDPRTDPEQGDGSGDGVIPEASSGKGGKNEL